MNVYKRSPFILIKHLPSVSLHRWEIVVLQLWRESNSEQGRKLYKHGLYSEKSRTDLGGGGKKNAVVVLGVRVKRHTNSKKKHQNTKPHFYLSFLQGRVPSYLECPYHGPRFSFFVENQSRRVEVQPAHLYLFPERSGEIPRWLSGLIDRYSAHRHPL